MKSVPRTSDPLAKSLRTAEFWLVAVANVALIVIPIITSALPASLAAKLAAGLDAVYAISRGIVKAPWRTVSEGPAPLDAGPVDGSGTQEEADEWRKRRYGSDS